jgi:hypothetical protein
MVEPPHNDSGTARDGAPALARLCDPADGRDNRIFAELDTGGHVEPGRAAFVRRRGGPSEPVHGPWSGPSWPHGQIPTGWTVEIADPWGNVLGLTDYVKAPTMARRTSAS